LIPKTAADRSCWSSSGYSFRRGAPCILFSPWYPLWAYPGGTIKSDVCLSHHQQERFFREKAVDNLTTN